MKEYTITVYNVNTGKIIDTFIGEFQSVDELRDFMDSELHNYNEPYLKLHYHFTEEQQTWIQHHHITKALSNQST